jgi:leucyl aminopeptidase
MTYNVRVCLASLVTLASFVYTKEPLSRCVSDALYEQGHDGMPLKNPKIVFGIADGNVTVPEVDMYIMFADESLKEIYGSKSLPVRCAQEVIQLCKESDFKGRPGECYLTNFAHPTKSNSGGETLKQIRFVVIGLGSPDDEVLHRVELFRRACGQAMRIIESSRLYTIAFYLPDPDWCSSVFTTAQAAVETLMISLYSFDAYISAKPPPQRDYSITLCAPAEHHEAVQNGGIYGTYIAQAVNRARYWSDSPPSVATPRFMANQAEQLAQRAGLRCTIFDPSQLKALGMGGILGVTRGSAEPCRLVVLEYKAPISDARTLLLVGKGVTFDAGGISLKPSSRMDEMKYDMAGAAAILASMELIAVMQPIVNVVAILPFVENMPSGSALKPGDIVSFYNGLTAEIKDTDAEGRLILADALSYGVDTYKPDFIIDIATLTGSCMHALGKFFAGLMTRHNELANYIIIAGWRSGDRVWVLPLHTDYKPAVRSMIADLANLGNGSYYAGAITAGWFLEPFTGNVPWAHLDIAGTAYGVPLSYYRQEGATAFGVRLLAALVLNWPQSETPCRSSGESG